MHALHKASVMHSLNKNEEEFESSLFVKYTHVSKHLGHKYFEVWNTPFKFSIHFKKNQPDGPGI